ncbi:MAG: hypothetical protein HKN13_14425, partial [Rhodothermales bacterium]|nr:hypothetical protein [Rhodothermales bacterium]
MPLRVILAIAFVVLFAASASAQLDRAEEISSLAGIERVGLVLDVEASGALASDPTLDASAVRTVLADRLESMT